MNRSTFGRSHKGLEPRIWGEALVNSPSLIKGCCDLNMAKRQRLEDDDLAHCSTETTIKTTP